MSDERWCGEVRGERGRRRESPWRPFLLLIPMHDFSSSNR
jgi:hypothetical protein